jgi:hypothetical protein
LDCYSYHSSSVYQGVAVSMPIPYNVGQYRTSEAILNIHCFFVVNPVNLDIFIWLFLH